MLISCGFYQCTYGALVESIVFFFFSGALSGVSVFFWQGVLLQAPLGALGFNGGAINKGCFAVTVLTVGLCLV